MIIQELEAKQIISPPKWLADNTAYVTIMGSLAYGVSNDASDEDLYGFCLPPKDLVFPWTAGEIPGFGRQVQKFDVWQEHHAKLNGKTYDFSIYSIVKYFDLCMSNNPNMIDSLFTPTRCVKHATEIGRMVRDRRKMFLHKGAWHKFKGYAYQQVHKIDNKRQAVPEIDAFVEHCAMMGIERREAFDRAMWIREDMVGGPVLPSAEERDLAMLASAVEAKGKRYVDIAKYGFDVKFSYHVVRLLAEVEQIMEEGDLDLERNREQLKAIRRGDWNKEDIVSFFESKEKELESLYVRSKLPHSPDEKAIKALLLDCLEQHYGTMSVAIAREAAPDAMLRELQSVIDRYKGA
jgi:hypothetical protein